MPRRPRTRTRAPGWKDTLVDGLLDAGETVLEAWMRTNPALGGQRVAPPPPGAPWPEAAPVYPQAAPVGGPGYPPPPPPPQQPPPGPPPGPSPFAVLGVKEGEDLATCKAVFKARARSVHPDRGGDARQFQALNEAMQQIERLHGKGKNKEGRRR